MEVKNGRYSTGSSVLNRIFIVSLIMITVTVVPIVESNDKMVQNRKITYEAPHCRHSKVHSMIQIRCYDMTMQEIPRHFNTDVQIFDGSYNMIQKLHSDSFSLYKKLAYIYLDNNSIRDIHEFAFVRQHYLEILDLSNNEIRDIPKNIFQLPFLRVVNLATNRLIDSSFKIKSVSSPLHYLQLHNNGLTKIPDIGILPLLTSLNVSRNKINNITTEQLAHFCNIQIFDASDNPINFERETCNCVTLRAWLKLRGIEFTPLFGCATEAMIHCMNVVFSNETMAIYEKCTTVFQKQAQADRVRYIWILVASGVSCFIILIILVLCWVHKLNKKSKLTISDSR